MDEIHCHKKGGRGIVDYIDPSMGRYYGHPIFLSTAVIRLPGTPCEMNDGPVLQTTSPKGPPARMGGSYYERTYKMEPHME